jgi:hypothetical protein
VFSDENDLITSLKNVPNRPFLMADHLSDGLVVMEKGKSRGFEGSGFWSLSRRGGLADGIFVEGKDPAGLSTNYNCL